MNPEQNNDRSERKAKAAAVRPPKSKPARLLASLAALAVAGSVVAVSSLALFTDQDSVAGNTFTTGNIELTAAPATAVVSATAMLPGDQDTAEMTITNSGNLELRYSVTSTTTEDVLASQLVLTIKTGVTTCDDAGWQTDGSIVYSGELGDAATINIIGDPAQGADTGDRVLAASAVETLCFNVTLPSSSDDTFEGLNSTATFVFDAEQTANNA